MPCLMFNQNGTITTRKTIKECVDLGGATLIVVTEDQTISGLVTIALNSRLSVTNGAVITINSGATLDIQGDFDAPSEDTWVNIIAGGTLQLPPRGSRLQNMIGKSMSAPDGSFTTSLLAGAFEATSALISGNLDAANVTTPDSGTVTCGTLSADFATAPNIPQVYEVSTKIIRGVVNGITGGQSGVGFTSSKLGTGEYALVLSFPYATYNPAVSFQIYGLGRHGYVEYQASGNTTLYVYIFNSAGVAQDWDFTLLLVYNT